MRGIRVVISLVYSSLMSPGILVAKCDCASKRSSKRDSRIGREQCTSQDTARAGSVSGGD